MRQRIGWLAAVAALGAFALRAQNVSLNDGGLSVGTDRRRPAVTPPALRGPIEMRSLPGVLAPSDFHLVNARSNRFGPFPYREGAPVGTTAVAFRLHVIDDNRFGLQPAAGGPALGPYAYSNGTVLRIGSEPLALVRAPPRLDGRFLFVTGAPGAQPSVCLGPLDRGMEQALARLRANFAAVAAQLASDTAPFSFEETPIVRMPGRREQPVIHRSPRDLDNARSAADRRAASQLDALCASAMPFRAKVDADGRFVCPVLPPGTYVFCARLRVPDPDATSAGFSRQAIWWTTLEFGPYDRIALDLTAKNAGGWGDIFR